MLVFLLKSFPSLGIMVPDEDFLPEKFCHHQNAGEKQMTVVSICSLSNCFKSYIKKYKCSLVRDSSRILEPLCVFWLQIYPLTSDIQKAEHLFSFQGSMVKQKPHKALLT